MKSFLVSFCVAVLMLGCGRPGNPVAITGAGKAITPGDGVSNGGGLGEKNLVYAYFLLKENLRSYMVAGGSGHLIDADDLLLTSIISDLDRGKETIAQVVFKSAEEDPGFFILNGRPKSARTGSNVGDKIYINIAHLYQKKNDVWVPLDMLACTSLLVHELAHHHGIRNTDEEIRRLDLLSAGIVHFLAIYGTDTDRTVLLRFSGKQEKQYLMQCHTTDRNSGVDYVNIYFEPKSLNYSAIVSWLPDYERTRVAQIYPHQNADGIEIFVPGDPANRTPFFITIYTDSTPEAVHSVEISLDAKKSAATCAPAWDSIPLPGFLVQPAQ